MLPKAYFLQINLMSILQAQLKKVKDGQTINNDVITGINPLIVINGKMGDYRKSNQSG